MPAFRPPLCWPGWHMATYQQRGLGQPSSQKAPLSNVIVRVNSYRSEMSCNPGYSRKLPVKASNVSFNTSSQCVHFIPPSGTRPSRLCKTEDEQHSHQRMHQVRILLAP